MNSTIATDRPFKVAFVVADTKAATRYFTEILDLKIAASYPLEKNPAQNFVFLQSESIYVELLPQEAMDGSPIGFHHLAFWSDDVSSHLDALRQRGADVTSGAYPAGVGGITLGDFKGPGDVLFRLFNQTK